jgi:hypothetical protein
MPDNSESAKAQIEIPYSLVEYTAVFKKPAIKAWAVPANLIDAVLTAIEPYGFNAEGVEVKTRTEKLSDTALIFKRTPPGITINLGVTKMSVSAENLDWDGAEKFMEEMNAALNATLKASDAELKLQQLTLLLHVQIKNKPRKDVTDPLFSGVAEKLLDGEVQFQGMVLNREKSFVLIDASVVYNNAIFIRLFREHSPERTLKEMSEILYKDEVRLFEVLKLEGGL